MVLSAHGLFSTGPSCLSRWFTHSTIQHSIVLLINWCHMAPMCGFFVDGQDP